MVWQELQRVRLQVVTQAVHLHTALVVYVHVPVHTYRQGNQPTLSKMQDCHVRQRRHALLCWIAGLLMTWHTRSQHHVGVKLQASFSFIPLS